MEEFLPGIHDMLVQLRDVLTTRVECLAIVGAFLSVTTDPRRAHVRDGELTESALLLEARRRSGELDGPRDGELLSLDQEEESMRNVRNDGFWLRSASGSRDPAVVGEYMGMRALRVRGDTSISRYFPGCSSHSIAYGMLDRASEFTLATLGSLGLGVTRGA